MPTTESHTNAAVRKIRVLLVEDHPIVRHGLRAMIDDEADLAVCGEASSVAEALPLLRQLKPDVAVIDIALGAGENGLDLIRRAHEDFPDMPLLALSMHDEAVYGERALRAGAKGYIMKKEAMDKLLTAIRRVLAGELYVSEPMAARLVNKLLNPAARDAHPSVESLSEREFQVFRLIAAGIGPSEIAQRLSVSVKTIETHREHIKEKLGLKSGPELTRFSLQWAMEHQ
jgi:DNA-binding NarL/FixJ family response regulator